jgi:ribosomal protein L32
MPKNNSDVRRDQRRQSAQDRSTAQQILCSQCGRRHRASRDCHQEATR